MKNGVPVTRKELHEEIENAMILVNEAFERMATKEDLKKLVSKQYLKAELQKVLEPYVTKEYLKEYLKEELHKALQPYATKEDIRGMLEETLERLESSVFGVQHDHERRIQVLEKRR